MAREGGGIQGEEEGKRKKRPRPREETVQGHIPRDLLLPARPHVLLSHTYQ